MATRKASTTTTETVAPQVGGINLQGLADSIGAFLDAERAAERDALGKIVTAAEKTWTALAPHWDAAVTTYKVENRKSIDKALAAGKTVAQAPSAVAFNGQIKGAAQAAGIAWKCTDDQMRDLLLIQAHSAAERARYTAHCDREDVNQTWSTSTGYKRWLADVKAGRTPGVKATTDDSDSKARARKRVSSYSLDGLIPADFELDRRCYEARLLAHDAMRMALLLEDELLAAKGKDAVSAVARKVSKAIRED